LNVYAMIQKNMKSGDGYQSVYKFYNTIEGIKLEEG
jgi:nucleoside-specific outer membrane channel protein Tsx